jgi:hypothetical protein
MVNHQSSIDWFHSLLLENDVQVNETQQMRDVREKLIQKPVSIYEQSEQDFLLGSIFVI